MAVTDRSHDERERQAAAAAVRYGETGDERRTVERQQDAGVAFPDSEEALAARAARLLDRQAVPASMVVEAVRAEPLEATAAYERILGVSRDLQAWSFLPRGTRAARTVARISVRENGRELPVGTGFLVSPNLLLTNHHVLPDAEAARQSFVEFDAQVTVDNTPQSATRLELDPDGFFAADQRLDFALVRVAPGPDLRPAGETFGWNRLSAQKGKLVIGEPVNVIGHPMGRLKEIAVRDNMLQVRLDDFLHYKTDTEPGNSGSPVFNDQWEIVALHHSGVPRTDGQGRVLRRDGQVWEPGDGDDAIDWVSNEGVRISSILKHLATLPLSSRQQALLAEMGPESGLGVAEAAAGPVAAPAPAVAASPPAVERVPARAGLRAREGAFGGRRHLVFLHGRSQEGLVPENLRRDWTAGLNQGLVRAGLPPVDPADVWFPYYGDRLVQALTAHEAVPHLVEAPTARAAEAVAPTAPTARAVYEEIIGEAATKWDMPHESRLATERIGMGDVVGALQKRLSWLAARSDLDAWAIALVFRDVAAYLDDQRIREEVLGCVLETMPDAGEVVLVSHSLGTVVGLDLTTRLSPGVDLVHLTTAGSPLGLDSVYSRLLVGGPKRPDVVADWLNVWCPTDAVAIGCPLGDDWADGLSDLAVVNARDRAHSIVEYLAHPDVARSIGSHLGG
ncbi:trypsin-like serine peptidase [Streptomyces europaeiscabiei]|uniref:trypsin-like serine peptidase n=2 Tax=Streptomyces europaeiscabiei TaxID=146819 RepID=UPI0029B167F0|nr:serine protease [Streptomyces europaeiscabiei]MDX2524484.1 serine protease [Streptomyces europaeiscabiei]MDX2757080.1 serine protease [Streptomyces europaeiscabiei]MDX2768021.1 serine protease [Streptomyces europaeiscabiei]MDX3672828.1 serine protease [Streptomyces europaeiscabiei]MDX3846101.1 serine protease [Streptomyces europaeiscabiei]